MPKADVTATSPTHLAVALKYDDQRCVPIAVAKDVDVIAACIREVSEH